MIIDNIIGNNYDNGLGIEPDIINYIKESHQIQIRVSPIRCYLLRRRDSGSVIASQQYPILINNYIETTPQYKAQLWPGNYPYPDIRPDVDGGRGKIILFIDNLEAKRVVDTADIIRDNEFAIIKRYDLNPQRVELVFNTGFNPTTHNIAYYYTDIDKDISAERMKSGETDYASPFNWDQYLNYKRDSFTDMHQILVRFPLTSENVVINEEGLVTLKENQCWTLWYPYISNFDVLIVPPSESPINKELRFQIIDKQDSIIQRVLVSQRFKVKLLTTEDKIYTIPYKVN